jgi:HEPN domain-containing protein
MNTSELPKEYLAKAKRRRLTLDVLRDAGGHDDVVRETQELVELLLKGLLRRVGVDPPKWHDVGRIVESHQNLFNDEIRTHISRIVKVSSRLRKDRELSFYGDDDFLPSQNYDITDSEQCTSDADFLIDLVDRFFHGRP